MKGYKKLLITLLLIASFTLLVQSVFATSITEQMRDKISSSFSELPSYDESNPPQEIIVFIINIALAFLGVIFIILVIYGGFLWMTSGGNEEQVTKAKNIIKRATIGLTIIIIALAITNFVITEILEATGAGGGDGIPHTP